MPKASYSDAATGAASGATTGFAIGGPAGAAVGGLFGGVASLWGGGKKKKRKVSTLDKRQQRIHEDQNNAFYGEGPLADLYNYDPEKANDVFEKTRVNPAYRNLNEKAIPSVTGQFRSNGLMQSGYAGDAIAKLTRDVQETLEGERSKYLYGEEKEARNAKRQGIENYQNRTTFAYDKNPGGGGFDVGSFLKSIPSEDIDKLREYLNKE